MELPPLPGLTPDDPQNLLSTDARRRIHRALILAEKHTQRAEVDIETRFLDPYGDTAGELRTKANLTAVESVLKVFRDEFGRVSKSLAEFQLYMREEIDAACSSRSLSKTHQNLLESEFYLPNEGDLDKVENVNARPTGRSAKRVSRSTASRMVTAETWHKLVGCL